MTLASCGGTKDAGQQQDAAALIQRSDIKIEGKRMTPEALWAMGRIGSVAVSPDEKQIAYTVSYYSVPQNKSNSEVFVMNADGSGNTQITHDAWQEGQPTWFKDGKKLAFLCNESGSTLRFILPLFSLTAQKVRFTGAGRLMQRPQEIYAQLFERQGLRFEQNEQGITIFGRLCPGTFTLPGNVSSQFISGLLFATPLMEAPSTIEVRAPFESRSYVDLTTDAMQKFGVKVSVRARKDGSATYKVAAPQHYAAADMDVEGDYSQAAFLAVLGSTVGGITITGLPSGSHQGDRVILDILKQCGAKFERSGSHVTFHRSLLKAVEIDLADCPDLGPVLIALGCFCSGTTIIRNAGRLRIKECDRIAAMQEELAKMGGTVKADGDTLTIEGCALHKPTAPLNGHNDHRIVMAMAVAALAAGQPAVIEGANAVNKSWPDFFEVIKGLGAHVTNQG